MGGGHYYWDAEADLWWSWDTPEAMGRKFPAIVEEKGLGGVFAWGLGEDAERFVHLEALSREMRGWERGQGGRVEGGREGSLEGTNGILRAAVDEL